MRETRKARRPLRKGWQRKTRRTTATTRGARVAATPNLLAARGKNLVPPAARNSVWCGECRVWMPYSWRIGIPHNSKTLLQKKATKKWYRAVPLKNLTERSERIPLAANSIERSAAPMANSVRQARATLEKQNAPDLVGSVLATRKLRRKTALVMAWKQAAETSTGPVLRRPASLVWMFRP
jgi:hypothetical protein